MGRHVVLHVFRRPLQVCHTRLLLENVFTFSHPTAYQNPIRLFGMLDHCQGKSATYIDF